MHSAVYLLAFLALVGPVPVVSAQQTQSPTQKLHLMSAAPGQEVRFRVDADAQADDQKGALQLLSSPAAFRDERGVTISTPSEIAIPDRAAFRAVFSTASAGERLSLVIPTEGREVRAEGARIVLERTEAGGPVQINSAESIDLRSPLANPTQP